MRKVRAPDGSIRVFAADMTDAEIGAVLAKEFPPGVVPLPVGNRSPRALPKPSTEWLPPVTHPDENPPPRDQSGWDNRSAARRRQDAGECPVLNAFRERTD